MAKHRSKHMSKHMSIHMSIHMSKHMSIHVDVGVGVIADTGTHVSMPCRYTPNPMFICMSVHTGNRQDWHNWCAGAVACRRRPQVNP